MALIFIGCEQASQGITTPTKELKHNTQTTSPVLITPTTTTPKITIPTSIKPVATQPTNNCDPNYSGACVPIASDVDCAGGSGNGPAYVRGPVEVTGSDIYDLDRDSDGVGCE